MNRKPNRPITAAPLTAALSLGAMMLAGAAVAAPLPTPQSRDSVVVQIGDLNTATPAGMQELVNRIRNAAWQVCMDVVPPGDTGPSHVAFVQCQETVTKEAIDTLDNPALSSRFEAALPRPRQAD